MLIYADSNAALWLFGNHYGGDDDDDGNDNDDDGSGNGNGNDDVVVIIIIITTTIMTIIITKQARHDAKNTTNNQWPCKLCESCKDLQRTTSMGTGRGCCTVQPKMCPEPTASKTPHLSGESACYLGDQQCYDSEEGPNCDESSIIQHDTLIFRNHHKSPHQQINSHKFDPWALTVLYLTWHCPARFSPKA